MKWFLGAGCALLAIDCPNAWAQEAITTPILSSARNFRDIAGISAAMGGSGQANVTTHDGVMRTGVFYRSNRLLLSSADATTVANLGITTDIDMRTPGEIAARPDTVPTSVNYVNIDVFGTSRASNATQMYQNFVTDSGVRSQLGAVLLELARASGPTVIHCEFGKDRTGWVSAVLESIAGVSSQTIMSDYLASNTYLNFPNAVEARNLQTALGQVVTSYGSMQAYLTQGLGLSQTDIYVLRAKMVYYRSLPGQAGFVGNAAQGGTLLNNLQNSPLSGTYTAFNYFLQSAVDAGTLDGMEQRVGGQIHADAATYLLREPLRINQAIGNSIDGRSLPIGRSALWQADLGQDFSTSAGDAAASRERSTGLLIGLTHRFNQRLSGYAGAGYNWGDISDLSIGAHADANAFVAVAGLRYGLASLDTGPYLAASGTFEAVHYISARDLGDGLGTARGRSNGHVLAGTIEAGDMLAIGHGSLTPHVGLGVTQVILGSFEESGSELALGVERISMTRSYAQAGLKARFAPLHSGAWTITPTADVDYVRAIDRAGVTGNASLYGFSVAQLSAFDSPDLFRGSLSLAAQRGPVNLSADANGMLGNGAQSRGYGGRIAFAYSF